MYWIDFIGKISLKSAGFVEKRYFELRESLSADGPPGEDAEAIEDSENGSEGYRALTRMKTVGRRRTR